MNNNTIRLFTVATYACKDRILNRLKINKPGPGYFNFPQWTTEDYLNQLTAESKVPVKKQKDRANSVRMGDESNPK